MELKLIGESTAVYKTNEKPLPTTDIIYFGNFQILTTIDGLNGRIFIDDTLVHFSPDFRTILTIRRDIFQELFEKDATAYELLKAAHEVVCVIDFVNESLNPSKIEYSLRLLANSIGGTFNRLVCFAKDTEFTKEIFYVTTISPYTNM